VRNEGGGGYFCDRKREESARITRAPRPPLPHPAHPPHSPTPPHMRSSAWISSQCSRAGTRRQTLLRRGGDRCCCGVEEAASFLLLLRSPPPSPPLRRLGGDGGGGGGGGGGGAEGGLGFRGGTWWIRGSVIYVGGFVDPGSISLWAPASRSDLERIIGRDCLHA